ncbi:MAG: iron-sulfur cluster assembly scaffold protein [Terriglobia bacterium]
MPYSSQVLDHFHHPRHAGEIPGATVIAEASNPVCGDALKFWLIVRDGIIREVGFKAGGCVPAMACGSWLAEWLEGREVAKLPLLAAREIERALGGLPAASQHAAALTITALDALVRAIRLAPET